MRTSRSHILFLFSIVLGLSGCSMDASIESLTSAVTEIIQKASNNEFVPASQQGVVTAQGYKVQSSLSFHSSKGEVVTAQGYKVQTSVQSTLYRE